MSFIKQQLKRLDFKFYPTSIICAVMFPIALLCGIYMPERYAYENSAVEIIQIIILITCVIFPLTIKHHKYLFRFVSLVAFILLLREISMGRVFFPISGKLDTYKKWSEIGVNSLIPNAIYVIIIAYSVIYFFQKKLWNPVYDYAKNARIAIWDFSFMVISVVISEISENKYHAFVTEECFETILYIAVLGIIYKYGFRPEFKLKSK